MGDALTSASMCHTAVSSLEALLGDAAGADDRPGDPLL
jgi:hypothetical protein